MGESYSGDDGAAAARADERVRELIARLLPGVDAALLTAALAAERGASTVLMPEAFGAPLPPGADPAARELARVRHQFAFGEAAHRAQHDVNNPLTALLAEAQLLELEPLAGEHREAASRIVGLARRIAAVIRRLYANEESIVG